MEDGYYFNQMSQWLRLKQIIQTESIKKCKSYLGREFLCPLNLETAVTNYAKLN